jgi:hypothetical protein
VSEVWKDVVGFEGAYEVSDMGRVRHKGGRIVPGHEIDGYRGVSLNFTNSRGHRDSKRRAVHLLMLEAFVGPRPAGMCSRHLNDVRSDNRLDNLAWGTHKENAADARRNGRLVRMDAATIREIRASTETDEEIAARLNRSVPVVFNARAGVSYQHVPLDDATNGNA